MESLRNSETVVPFLNHIIDQLIQQLRASNSQVYWLSADFRSIISSTGLSPKDADRGAIYILESLIKQLNDEETLIVSAFNFTFPQTSRFDVSNTAVQTGAFGSILTQHYPSHRTLHPFYSFLAFGKYHAFLTSHFFANGTGKDSIFEWIVEHETQLICLGHHYVKSLTSIHHAEQTAEVPYRYNKTFQGTLVTVNKEEHEITANFYVRELGVCDFSSLTIEGDQAFRSAGLVDSKLIQQLRRPLLCHSINHKAAHQLMISDLCNNKDTDSKMVDYFGPNRIRDNVITSKLADKLYNSELSQVTAKTTDTV